MDQVWFAKNSNISTSAKKIRQPALPTDNEKIQNSLQERTVFTLKHVCLYLHYYSQFYHLLSIGGVKPCMVSRFLDSIRAQTCYHYLHHIITYI